MNDSRRWTGWRWRSRVYYCLILLLAFITVSVKCVHADSARLGPVDGEGLAATDLERVKVGAAAPDFTLESEKGHPITLSQFRGQKNVILVFYRGHW